MQQQYTKVQAGKKKNGLGSMPKELYVFDPFQF